MNFLLDTMVVSEWVKQHPNPGVVAWLADSDEDRVFISVVTLAELRYGIERMAAAGRRKRLDDWLRNELPVRFEGRLLSIDALVADHWGTAVARSEAAGRPISAMDAWIAATALAHGMTLVTRNMSDFEASLKRIMNPWADDEGASS
jgi:predicted nucleic acid-binding protein